MRAFPDELRGHWNHNTHYYVDALPRAHPGGRALDVGCGDGLLLRLLAGRCREVVGLDVSPEMVEQARATCRDLDNVTVLTGDLLTTEALVPASFDLVTSYATIHHVPFEPALRHMAALVRPGGQLLVVGLASDRSPARWLVGGVAHRLLTLRHGFWDHGAPVTEPTMSRREIRRAAQVVLPGAAWRRHVLWRYSLRWTKPVG